MSLLNSASLKFLNSKMPMHFETEKLTYFQLSNQLPAQKYSSPSYVRLLLHMKETKSLN